MDVLVSCTIAGKNGDLDHVIFTAVDVTERKNLEAQLRQSQKMEAVGQLAGGVAHDFNNQLTIIRGYCDLMLDDPQLSSETCEQLKHVDSAAARAGRLTSQLLAFSRKQVLKPESIHIGTVMEEMHRPLARMVGEDVEIQFICGDGELTCKLDRGQLEQAIINLAINARDAMPRGGTLNVRCQRADFSSEAEAPEGIGEGAYACLELTDTGEGMTEATRQHLFEPFFTTKDVGKGTGLGLSMVYGFVSQSNGTITVESEIGKGTSFRLYFPLTDEAATAKAAVPDYEMQGGNETILVVEDEEAVRHLIARVLGGLGYTVIQTESPEEACKIGCQGEASIDLLLADVVMPGWSGPEVAARVLEVRPEMCVLYISGYLKGEAVRRGLVETHANLLPKPFGPKELAAAVRECLDQARHPAHPA